MMGFRVEKDTMGTVWVPEKACYGAQTQRALENFPISGLTFQPEFFDALALIKKCSARVNKELGLLPAEIADAFRKEREEVGRRMEFIIRSGVKFAAGTDGMHGELAKELEYIVGFGASESKALAAVTRNAAAVLGLEGSVGTLEPGKFADVVAVRGNPLKDIRALKEVGTVISRGKVISSEIGG